MLTLTIVFSVKWLLHKTQSQFIWYWFFSSQETSSSQRACFIVGNVECEYRITNDLVSSIFPDILFLAFFLLSLKILFLFPIDVIQSSLFAKHIALAFIYTTNLWFSSNVILAKISTLQCCRCRKRGFVPVKYFTRHLNGLNIDNTVICVSASFYLLSFWDIYQPHFPSYTRTKQAITKDND